MMWRIEIISQAKADIRKTILWYNQKQDGIGKIFLTNVRADVKLIQLNPTAFPMKYKEVRTKVMHRFPYLIHYIIDSKAQKLIIIAVFHMKINPFNLNKRYK
jgi:toxin ParE1/3/4